MTSSDISGRQTCDHISDISGRQTRDLITRLQQTDWQLGYLVDWRWLWKRRRWRSVQSRSGQRPSRDSEKSYAQSGTSVLFHSLTGYDDRTCSWLHEQGRENVLSTDKSKPTVILYIWPLLSLLFHSLFLCLSVSFSLSLPACLCLSLLHSNCLHTNMIIKVCWCMLVKF